MPTQYGFRPPYGGIKRVRVGNAFILPTNLSDRNQLIRLQQLTGGQFEEEEQPVGMSAGLRDELIKQQILQRQQQEALTAQEEASARHAQLAAATPFEKAQQQATATRFQQRTGVVPTAFRHIGAEAPTQFGPTRISSSMRPVAFRSGEEPLELQQEAQVAASPSFAPVMKARREQLSAGGPGGTLAPGALSQVYGMERDRLRQERQYAHQQTLMDSTAMLRRELAQHGDAQAALQAAVGFYAARSRQYEGGFLGFGVDAEKQQVEQSLAEMIQEMRQPSRAPGGPFGPQPGAPRPQVPPIAPSHAVPSGGGIPAGTRRQVGGQLLEWDGQGWFPVQ